MLDIWYCCYIQDHTVCGQLQHVAVDICSPFSVCVCHNVLSFFKWGGGCCFVVFCLQYSANLACFLRSFVIRSMLRRISCEWSLILHQCHAICSVSCILKFICQQKVFCSEYLQLAGSKYAILREEPSKNILWFVCLSKLLNLPIH